MAKKHKKKVYTTPKKIKHIHQKQDLNSFINSFSKERCESCQSIMASHENRNYCGFCNYSIAHNSCKQQEME